MRARALVRIRGAGREGQQKTVVKFLARRMDFEQPFPGAAKRISKSMSRS